MCFTPGALKSTYGTGCFVIINTGAEPVASKNKLLTTIGYRLDGKRPMRLRDQSLFPARLSNGFVTGLKIIKSASEDRSHSQGTGSNNGVYMVPALTGLGAPHWAPNARGAVYGITRDTGPGDFVRAALESVAYQTNDLFMRLPVTVS